MTLLPCVQLRAAQQQARAAEAARAEAEHQAQLAALRLQHAEEQARLAQEQVRHAVTVQAVCRYAPHVSCML